MNTTSAELNFIRQQGFVDATSGACALQYPALMWQPRATAVVVLVAILFQSWELFAFVGAVLVWNVAVPRLSICDALYNRLVAGPRGHLRLGPAPAPRRFAQGLAASFMIGAAVSLIAGWTVAAWALQGFVVIALGALLLGRFCIGSYVYLLLTGRGALARRTVPWATPDA